jgi:SAM-dependent methyltransferase
MTVPARYDGSAAWYDRNIAGETAAAAPLVMRLAGAGLGRALDLGCGTGVHLLPLEAAGWSVVGLDASADQLQMARQRAGAPGPAPVRGDAARLPFPDGSFELVVSAFTHTDVEDFGAVAREACRILRPGGRFAYLGLHPCFVGPPAEKPRPDGAVVVHPEYRRAGWRRSGPGTRAGGLADRVGFHHLPLADMLNGVLDAGLRLQHVEEAGDHRLPTWLALVARR